MKDNKKKFTGKELGIIVLNNIKRILEGQELIYSKEEITVLESSLNGKRNIDKFREYKVMAGNVEDILYTANHNISETYKNILILIDIIKEEFIRLRLSYYEQLLPILVTPKQYNDVGDKEDFKNVKFSLDTISEIGLPVYSKNVEYELKNIPEIAIVTNPREKNIDDMGYYKQQRADEYFDKNIAFHNRYEGVEDRCKWLMKSVGESLKNVFIYYEFVKLISDNVNVDFISIIDGRIEELNLYIDHYNLFLKATVKFKKVIPEIDITKFKLSKAKIARANKKINRSGSPKNTNWLEVFEVLTR